MPIYTPPLRDMQFVLHELLNVTDELKLLPKYAEIDVDTINAVLEEGSKFAADVLFPLNLSGDQEVCTLDRATHEAAAVGARPTPSAAARRGGSGSPSLR